ncbi:CoA ester lyase [Parvularcula marina]|uniref:HpcH/HpaI aldolase/citrate lyase family protein n=1 Tax=Parvularcula marina TaxID=2292771 RepID=UPI003516AB2E
MTSLETEGWRSLLFVPGSRPDRFDKALAAGADVVCIDLEDAVAPDGKDDAREQTFGYLAQPREGGPALGLRINGVDTEAGSRDLDAIGALKGADFLMLPKVADLADIEAVIAAGCDLPIIVVLESANGVLEARAIAQHRSVIAAIYGAIDLSADIGCSLDWEAHLYGRSHCALCFGAEQKVLFDSPYLDVKDLDGLKEMTSRAARLGIHARSAIHPAQLAPIHEALSPSAEEVAEARRILEAFDAAKGGVALLDGKMIELPVIKSARRVLARAGD